jgi:hypothetical protein
MLELLKKMAADNEGENGGALTDLLQKFEELNAERNKPGEIKITIEGWKEANQEEPLVREEVKEFILIAKDKEQTAVLICASKSFQREAMGELTKTLLEDL